ncbi:hypothetical protein BDN72DRAFT_848835 [Pluteus cervinus]|uniref:Uncharacterized protein n=1 Tax=Pluteus cervinus TaxID=181527 RepID=A0ACD3AA42_9AGAR|nr:hypothetical protein BDN72DRAFT_848835 [Pluteus cervinus]
MILNKELTKYSSILLVVLGLGNCLVTSLHTWLSFGSHSKPTPERGIRKAHDSEYSYIDRDYPIEFPFPPLPTVALTLHDSAVFSLNSVAALNSTSNITASLSPADKAKWETIVVHPHGMGRVQLGPSKRLFNTVFYHQLHCVAFTCYNEQSWTKMTILQGRDTYSTV